MIAHLSYVMCDRCGNPSTLADDAKEARRLARLEDHFVRLGRGRTAEDLCRQCAEMQSVTRERRQGGMT